MLLIVASVMCQLAAALLLKGQALLGAGYGALFTAVSITAYNLRVLEVNVVVALSALCFPALLALSRFVFDERLTKRQWIGLFIICADVILCNPGVRTC